MSLFLVPDTPGQDYERWFPLAWRSLKRLGVPPGSLHDAVQDVFLVVHRRQQDFKGQSTFQTWLFGILVRVASAYRRGRSRAEARFVSNDAPPIEQAASDAPSPFEHLAQGQAVELLRHLLDELEPELRDVFVLAELEELSLPQVAEALAITEATCKSRLRSARRRFNAAVARERARDEWRLR